MYRTYLIVAALAALAAPAAAQEVKHFKSWTAVCNNLKTCSALGYTEEGGGGPDGFIRIVREAGPQAAPLVILGEQTGDDVKDIAQATWTVKIDGKLVSGLDPIAAKASKAAYGERRAVLTPTQSAVLLAALRNGSGATIASGAAAMDITLAGSSAAMLWIDDRQGRVGTVTALAAKGAKPATEVPAAPAAPVIHPAPTASQAGLPTKLPKLIADNKSLKDCDDPTAQAQDPIVARLGPNQLLWAAPCSAGAYNLLSVLFIADEAGRGAREIVPPDAQQPDPDADDELMNIDYDAATRTLSAFAKGRGLGDCGSVAKWVWDGQAFRLADEQVMPDCQGVATGDWPSLYHAERAR